MRTDMLFLVALVGATACTSAGTDRKAEAPVAGDSTSSTTAALREPPSPGAVAGGELVYVTNEDSRNLSVVDAGTDRIVTTIEVGTRPRGVHATADGRTIFVAVSGSPKCPPTMPDAECEKLQADKSKDGVAVVDAATRKVTRVLPGGSDPENFDISADGTRLFVSNEDAGVASVVDIASGKIVSSVRVGREPEGVRVQPDGKAVWVTGETDHNVTIIDAGTGKRLGAVSVGKRPRGIAFTPDGKRAYVTCEVDGTVWVIDAKARKAVKTLTLPAGSKPMGVAISPDGGRVYVSTGRGGTVEVIDAGTNAIVGSVAVGKRPWGVALSADGRKLYTANGPSNDVTVVDAQTLKVIARIRVGEVPWGVAVAPAPGAAPAT